MARTFRDAAVLFLAIAVGAILLALVVFWLGAEMNIWKYLQ